jgi:hypothetical protein
VARATISIIDWNNARPFSHFGVSLNMQMSGAETAGSCMRAMIE